MSDPFDPDKASLADAVVQRIGEACDRFEAAWKSGAEPRIEDYLAGSQEPERSALLYGLLSSEIECRSKGGNPPTPEEYRSRFPGDGQIVDSLFGEGTAPTRLADTVAWGELGTGVSGDAALIEESAIPGRKFGRFELLGLLGRGAFGSVYRAHDPRLDRDVAVKIPRVGTLGGEEEVARFWREARAAAQLRHPHIVPVHETDSVESTHYIVSDFVEGQNLRQHLQQRQRFPQKEAAALVAKLARALHYAHSKGIVHRDVKPENILLDADGEPQITDFGLARREHGEGLETREGTLMGTPAYMSPEQAKGQSHRVDGRSDLWSLGVMLYEMLTGTRPFAGQESQLLVAILETEPPWPRKLDRSIPKDLETICVKCLAKDPGGRYSSCQDLAVDLERFCAGEPILARRQSLLAYAWRKVRRRPVLSMLIAAALVVIVLGGFLVRHGLEAQRQAQHDREVASILRELEGLYGAGDWSPAALADMDATIDQLEHRMAEPKLAAETRAKLVREFSAAVEEELHRASLGQKGVARIETWLEALANRDAESAERLEAEYHRRLRKWETVFDLAAPFDALDEVFDPDQVRVHDGKLTLAGKTTGAEVIYANRASRGRVGLEVVFDESWGEAEQLGLFLDMSASAMPSEGDAETDEEAPGKEDRHGYSFLIRPSRQEKLGDDAPGAPAPSTFGAAREEGGSFVAEILRDQACLQRQGIEAGDVPPGPLRLKATKMEDQLQFEVGTLRPVEFRDPFAFRGSEGVKFAVRWPPVVQLVRVRGLRQALPEEPSELEKADWLYAQARFAEALAAYQEEAQARDAKTGREARYKAATCLLALGRESEADAMLEQLAVEQHQGAASARSPRDELSDPWPALAACRLWSRRVRQRRFDEADALYASLSAGYRSEEIAQMIPTQVRDQILGAYVSQSKSLNLYRPNTGAVRACQRAVAIADFFETSSWLTSSGHLKRCLLRAHRACDQEEQALEIAAGLARDPRAVKWPDVVVEYAWMLRVAGRHEEALAALDDWIARAAGRSGPPREVILERTRTLAALDRWEEAEKSLEEALRGVSPEKPGWDYTSAWATLGFVREQLGDTDGAQQAWKQGLQIDWQTPWMGFQFVDGLILASCTGELSESDTRLLIERVLQWLPSELGENPVIQSLVPVEFVTSVLHNTFRTPRGRQYARQIVLREIPFAECVRTPPMLVVAEGIHQGAMPETMTDQQQALVWQLVGDGYTAVSETGRVGRQQLMWLAVTWTGAAGRFAWQAVAPTLDPHLRGRIAYVMGQRYLRLEQAEDAAFFFQTALDDAAPGSPLEALAQAELDRLAAAAEPISADEKAAP